MLKGLGREFDNSSEWRTVSCCGFLELFLGNRFAAKDLENVVGLGLRRGSQSLEPLLNASLCKVCRVIVVECLGSGVENGE